MNVCRSDINCFHMHNRFFEAHSYTVFAEILLSNSNNRIVTMSHILELSNNYCKRLAGKVLDEFEIFLGAKHVSHYTDETNTSVLGCRAG